LLQLVVIVVGIHCRLSSSSVDVPHHRRRIRCISSMRIFLRVASSTLRRALLHVVVDNLPCVVVVK